MRHPIYRLLELAILLCASTILHASIEVTDIQHPTPGNADGCVTILAEGETGPFMVSTSSNIDCNEDGLLFICCGYSEGNYTIEVIDKDGCVKEIEVTFDEEVCKLDVKIEDKENVSICTVYECSGEDKCEEDGFIELDISGSSNYSVTWSSTNMGFANTSKDIYNIGTGVYYYEVTDLDSYCKVNGEVVINVCAEEVYINENGFSYCQTESHSVFILEDFIFDVDDNNMGNVHVKYSGPFDYVLYSDHSDPEEGSSTSSGEATIGVSPGLYNLDLFPLCGEIDMFSFYLCDNLRITDIHTSNECYFIDEEDVSGGCIGSGYLGGTIVDGEPQSIGVEGNIVDNYQIWMEDSEGNDPILLTEGYDRLACAGTYTVYVVEDFGCEPPDRCACDSDPVVVEVPENNGEKIERRVIDVNLTQNITTPEGEAVGVNTCVIDVLVGYYCSETLLNETNVPASVIVSNEDNNCTPIIVITLPEVGDLPEETIEINEHFTISSLEQDIELSDGCGYSAYQWTIADKDDPSDYCNEFYSCFSSNDNIEAGNSQLNGTSCLTELMCNGRIVGYQTSNPYVDFSVLPYQGRFCAFANLVCGGTTIYDQLLYCFDNPIISTPTETNNEENDDCGGTINGPPDFESCTYITCENGTQVIKSGEIKYESYNIDDWRCPETFLCGIRVCQINGSEHIIEYVCADCFGDNCGTCPTGIVDICTVRPDLCDETDNRNQSDNIIENKIKVTPNPFSNDFTLSIDNIDSEEVYEYMIVNSQGKVIETVRIDIHKGKNEILITNLRNQPDGIYTLLLHDQNGIVKTLRMIKIK